MTVIVWDLKTLASDSLIAYEDGTLSHMDKKLFRLASGAMVGCAGDFDWRDMLKLLQNVHSESDFPSKEDMQKCHSELDLILVLPNKEVYNIIVTCVSEEYDTWRSSVERIPGKCASGVGRDFALAVLDAGGSAVDAVKGAIKRSLFCGGPVQTMTLDDKPKAVKKTKKEKSTVIKNTENVIVAVEDAPQS